MRPKAVHVEATHPEHINWCENCQAQAIGAYRNILLDKNSPRVTEWAEDLARILMHYASSWPMSPSLAAAQGLRWLMMTEPRVVRLEITSLSTAIRTKVHGFASRIDLDLDPCHVAYVAVTASVGQYLPWSPTRSRLVSATSALSALWRFECPSPSVHLNIENQGGWAQPALTEHVMVCPRCAELSLSLQSNPQQSERINAFDPRYWRDVRGTRKPTSSESIWTEYPEDTHLWQSTPPLTCVSWRSWTLCWSSGGGSPLLVQGEGSQRISEVFGGILYSGYQKTAHGDVGFSLWNGVRSQNE